MKNATLALLVLLALGLLLRLVLAFVVFPHEGLSADIEIFAKWSLLLAREGPGEFYANNPTINDTPGFLYLFWLLGLAANGVAGLTGTATPELIADWLKLPMILIDLVVAIVLFRAVRRWQSPQAGLFAAGAYLFTPVTWYMSALWGQVDALGFLAVALALIWLIDRRPELASTAAVVAFLIKPQFAVVLPIVGIILVSRHLFRRPGVPDGSPTTSRFDARLNRRFGLGPVRLVTSALLATVVALILIVPFDLETRASAFANIPVLGDVAGLINIVLARGASFAVLTANAFNPWVFAGPYPLVSSISGEYSWTFDSIQFLGVSAFIIGVASFLAVALTALAFLWSRDDRYSILLASVVLSTAFFVLLTRNHERYLFTAVALGCFLIPRSTSWLAWFVAASAVLLVNMHAILSSTYAGYGTPAMQALPFAAASREPVVVAIAAIASAALLAWPLWLMVRRWCEPAGAATTASR